MSGAKTFEKTRIIDYKLLRISSDAFKYEGMIPANYTCDGANINPSLQIEDIPEATKSLAIIVDDPDAPHGSFCHWVIWNIPVTHLVKENENRGSTGMNDFDRQAYNGPCPPSGIYHYNFKIYALDCTLDIPVTSGKSQVEIAMSDHIIGLGVITGKYKKKIH